MADDPIDHPAHYTSHPSGVECIQVTEHMGFNLGNAMKYIWRADLKGDAIEDLRKAAWYVNREIERLSGPSEDEGRCPEWRDGKHRPALGQWGAPPNCACGYELPGANGGLL